MSWGRPPRVERVDAGSPAERAGLRPGDHVVFVESQNVVTEPRDEILSLIQAATNQLVLEIYRKGGAGQEHRPSSVTLPPPLGPTNAHHFVTFTAEVGTGVLVWQLEIPMHADLPPTPLSTHLPLRFCHYHWLCCDLSFIIYSSQNLIYKILWIKRSDFFSVTLDSPAKVYFLLIDSNLLLCTMILSSDWKWQNQNYCFWEKNNFEFVGVTFVLRLLVLSGRSNAMHKSTTEHAMPRIQRFILHRDSQLLSRQIEY